MPDLVAMDRRSFIKVGALAGGGLVLGFRFGADVAGAQSQPAAATAADAGFQPNAFLRLYPTGAVSLIAPNSEMGQGAKTALPMIIAEELDADWKTVTVYQADLNPAYGRQMAVGSQSTPTNYTPLRQAGATARALLLTVGAQSLGAPESECYTENSAVFHRPSGRKMGYGELAAKAAALPVPPANGVQLKDPANFKLLGTRVPGVDNPKIVTGQPLFGIDQQLPGMLYAVYIKSPVFVGKPVGANFDEVKQLPGVKDAFLMGGLNGLVPGIAVVADSTWSALKAAEALKIQWDEGDITGQNSADYAKQAAAFAAADPSDLPADNKNLTATYHYPYLAHATLEPQNCTALFKDGVMEMWCPTQAPSAGQRSVTGGLGLAPGNVIVHVTRMGGGFGRRGSNEFSLEVAAIAQKFAGTPVKLLWTREHDTQHDNYRTAGWHFFQGMLDSNGKIAVWRDHFVTTGRNGQAGTAAGMNQGEFPGGGFIRDFRFTQSVVDTIVPTGYWRAPGANGNCWAVQSYLDELASASNRDRRDFHYDLLTSRPAPAAGAGGPGGGFGGRGGGGGGLNPDHMIEVIKLATEKADWGRKLPKGQGQGLAYSFTNNSYVAVVADVTVTKEGVLHVDRLVAAVNAGLIVNLSSAENQVQGAMIDGLGAAWFLKVTVDKGRVQQNSFDDYPLISIPNAPTLVEAHFIKSVLPPNGLGEPALPPTAPAVCNAIFAATGVRIRTLPIADGDLKWS